MGEIPSPFSLLTCQSQVGRRFGVKQSVELRGTALPLPHNLHLRLAMRDKKGSRRTVRLAITNSPAYCLR